MKRSVYLQFGQKSPFIIKLRSNQVFSVDEILLKAYLPGVQVTKKVTKVNLEILHSESRTQHYIIRGNTLRIFDAWAGNISIDSLFLIYAVIRKLFIQHRLYPMHAACLEKNTRGILLAGHSGSGKSTIACELMKKYNYRLFSGNKTVISWNKEAMIAEDGTTTVTMETKRSPRFSKLAAAKQTYQNRIAWTAKQNVQSSSSQLAIRTIILPTLNDGENEIKQLSQESALHALFPLALDAVNADIVFGKNIFDGSVSEKAKSNAAEALKKSLPHIKVYKIVGSLSFITNQINQL